MVNSQNRQDFHRDSAFRRGCVRGLLFAAAALALSNPLWAETVNVSGMNDGTNYENVDIVNTLGQASYNHTGSITGTSSLTINAPVTSNQYRQWLKGSNGNYSFTGPITVNGGQLLINSGKLQTKSIILNGGDMYVMYADCLPHDAVVEVHSGSMLDVESAANSIIGATINVHDGGSFRLAAANHNSETNPITLNIAGEGTGSSLGAIQAYGDKSDLRLNAVVNLTDDAELYLAHLDINRQFLWSGDLNGASTLTLRSDNAGRWIRMENIDMTGFSGDFVVSKVKARFYAPSLGTGSSITVQDSATAYFKNTAALAAYEGDFIVNNATIAMEAAGKLNNLSGNGTLSLGSFAVTLNNTKASAFSGVISGSGNVTKTGSETLTLSGANTYTGGTTISEGTISISNTQALGTGMVTLNGGALNASATGSGKTFPNAVTVGENGGAITVANSSYSSFASLSGSGDLTTNGYLHFNGTGGYSGHLTVAGGYTRLGTDAFGVFDATVIGQLNTQAAGTVRIGKLNGTGTVFATVAGNVLELGAGTVSSDTASFSGTIRGQGGNKNLTIKKVGEGTQTLNRTGYLFAGTNDSLKEIIIDGGRLIVDANHSTFKAENTKGFFHCPITVNEGGTLEYVRSWTTSPNIDLTLNGGTLQLDSAQYLNKLNFNSGTVTGASNTPLRAGFVGSGVWNVTGGDSVIENSVEIVKNGNYTTFTLNIADGASLEMERNFIGLSGYTGTTVSVNGTGTSGTGLLKLHSGADIPKVTGFGTMTFNGADVQINGGVETWSGDGFFANDVVLTNADLNVNADAGKTIKLDRKISGTGTITKTGAGTMLLAGEEGEISVQSLTVSAGRANVDGFLTGNLTISDGGVFSPGDGIGSTTLDGNLSAASGAKFLFEIGADTCDTLILDSGSALNISEDAFLELLFTDANEYQKYTLIEAKDGLDDYDTAFWSSLLTFDSSRPWEVSVVGNTLQAMVDRAAVPEPATWVLLVLGTFGLLYCRKK